jgi:hypothetical protein
MSDLDRFAAWWKHRRIALDFTCDELAKRAHCAVSTLRRLEAGDAVTAAVIISVSEKHRLIAQANRPEIEESIAQVREKTGAAFEAAWARGRALSLDEAVPLAIEQSVASG